jgi:RNA polymerase sigma-70 factor, ECF subfamily
MCDQSKQPSSSELLRRATSGDEDAAGQVLELHRHRLRRMIALRIDRRLQSRVDPSDIIQEAYVDAARRLPEYTSNPSMPFYVWLRCLAAERLVDQYRRHLGAQARDVSREFTLYRGAMPEANSAALAAQLLGRTATPCAAAIRAERRIRLQDALNQMEPIDREILALRHFEQMTNGEVAAALSIDKSAASKRYARALVRLKDILRSMPGGIDET